MLTVIGESVCQHLDKNYRVWVVDLDVTKTFVNVYHAGTLHKFNCLEKSLVDLVFLNKLRNENCIHFTLIPVSPKVLFIN